MHAWSGKLLFQPAYVFLFQCHCSACELISSQSISNARPVPSQCSIYSSASNFPLLLLVRSDDDEQHRESINNARNAAGHFAHALSYFSVKRMGQNKSERDEYMAGLSPEHARSPTCMMCHSGWRWHIDASESSMSGSRSDHEAETLPMTFTPPPPKPHSLIFPLLQPSLLLHYTQFLSQSCLYGYCLSLATSFHLQIATVDHERAITVTVSRSVTRYVWYLLRLRIHHLRAQYI